MGASQTTTFEFVFSTKASGRVRGGSDKETISIPAPAFVVPPAVGDLVMLPGLEKISLVVILREYQIAADGNVTILLLLDLVHKDEEAPRLRVVPPIREG